MTDATPAASSIDPHHLARVIDQLEQNIDAINRTQKTARLVVLGPIQKLPLPPLRPSTPACWRWRRPTLSGLTPG